MLKEPVVTGRVRLDPIGFWSYASEDDQLSGGKLSQLRKLLQNELQQQFGRRIQIFQDKITIPHGAAWEREIRRALANATFFIPIVTPSFVQSEWCCREVALFVERERELAALYPGVDRESRIFPIRFIGTQHAEPHDPEIVKVLDSRQWLEFLPYRHKSYENEALREQLAEFAASICDLLQVRVASPDAGAGAAAPRLAEDERRASADEAERLAAGQSAREEAERLAAEQSAREEAERLAAEEAARQEAVRQAAEQARANFERRAAEEARQEAERKAAEQARAAAEQRAAEQARQEAERRAAEQARADAERRVAEEAARREAQRLADEAAAKEARRAYFAQVATHNAEAEAEDGRRDGESALHRERMLRFAAFAALTLVFALTFWALWALLPAGGGEAARADPVANVAGTGSGAETLPAADAGDPVPPPAAAWLFGRWTESDAGNCAQPLVIAGAPALTDTGRRDRLLVDDEGTRRTQRIEESDRDSVETNRGVYRLGEGGTMTLRRLDNGAETHYSRCGEGN